MHAEPKVLQQILRVRTISDASQKKSKELRADCIDQRSSGLFVGLLIPRHELLESEAHKRYSVSECVETPRKATPAGGKSGP
jgi:hypothetical protein